MRGCGKLPALHLVSKPSASEIVAAVLAARHSKAAQSGVVQVTLCKARQVSKPLGAKPGGPKPPGARPAGAGARPAGAKPAGAKPPGARPGANGRPAGAKPRPKP